MEPRRRLSLVRLLILALIVSGLGFFGWTQGSEAYLRITAKPSSTWFAPYEDVTLTPEYHFEDPTVSPSSTQVLGFVVSDPKNACNPTWGTYYDLDGAGRALDLDRRITRLRERGGDAIVSFGGAVNDELAVGCQNQAALTAAYRTVVQRYSSRIIDFDIEGAALSNVQANERRARAIRTLQGAATSPSTRLRVWLTLPVTPAGLTADGVNVVSTMVRGGDRLDGINVMTMDFGGSLPAGQSMRTGVEHALIATERQIAAIYRQAGVVMTERQIWQHLGATPMIGRNDVAGETFSLSDADAFVAFARKMHLARVSMWSANRDSQCGVQAIDDQVSNTCSGVPQKQLAFTWELGRLNGKPPVHATAPALADPARLPTRDNPATSPYPVWRVDKAYRVGAEVVWHQRVYEAKWYTQGYLPDTPVKHLWDTPWRYIGPVLKSDAQSTVAGSQTKLRPWNADQVYLEGTRVVFDGMVYQARWWTQADTPTSDPDRPADVPWKLLGAESAADIAASSTSVVPTAPTLTVKAPTTPTISADGLASTSTTDTTTATGDAAATTRGGMATR
jgi:chitinase